MNTSNLRDVERNGRPAGPDAPDPYCKHRHKTEWLGIKSASDVPVYQCHECGRIITKMGSLVLNPKVTK